MSNRYDVNFSSKKDIKKKIFDQVTIFVSKINSFGKDAEKEKCKRLKFLTIFEIIKFVLNERLALSQFSNLL